MRSNAPTEWVHLKSYLVERRRYFSDAPALRWWGLLREHSGHKDDGNPRGGHYGITELGHQFVRGEVSVPKYVYLYNQKPVRKKTPDPDRVTIVEALGDRFNYHELMRPSEDSSSD